MTSIKSLNPELRLKETWLRYFVTVAETGNIQESARLLAVTTDTVRRNLRELESLLGVLLLLEIDGRLYPTSDGFTLLRQAQQILKGLEDTSELFSVADSPFQQPFSCGWTSIWPLYQMSTMLDHLAQKYTSIYNSVQWFNEPETIEKGLLEGSLDLGFTSTRPQAKQLQFMQGIPIPYVLVSAIPEQQHWSKLKYAMARKWDDPPKHYQNWDYTKYPVDVILEADSLDPVLDMALSGLAVAWLPHIIVENYLRLGWLHIVSEAPMDVLITPHVLWKKKTPMVASAIDFFQTVWQK